jgi:hypothetical protein
MQTGPKSPRPSPLTANYILDAPLSSVSVPQMNRYRWTPARPILTPVVFLEDHALSAK